MATQEQRISDHIGTVVIAHLTNGTPVIGRLKDFDEDAGILIFDRLCELHFMPNPRDPASMGVQYVPFLSFGGIFPLLDTSSIDTADTFAVRVGANVPKAFENGYLQHTSGVQIAPAGSVPPPSRILTGR